MSVGSHPCSMFCQLSIVGSLVQNESQLMGKGGWGLLSAVGISLTCHCTIYVLTYDLKGTLHYI